ncbi:MAG: DUF5107 domain-containing protein [Clostridia bacterium]|nr:DUF5107 domain-containing protein [Clostridia bacterium]
MESVKVFEYMLTLPTYPEPEPEDMPMFAQNRVHQRSSGNPYPNPVVVRTDRSHKEDKEYICICIENEFLKIELLPQLGGRVYSALDKRTGYDFFYKQHVIKPALIGMLGSWISGGIEFNWPCHHRPSTFMPVDYKIEREKDGAVTVWMSENEPLDRMKGMVGIRLAPFEAGFETRMRVFNRTETRKSFLWWENAAVPVNEDYELFFPPDVHFVQFHYRKNVTSFPIAKGVYNGIRMGEGVDIRKHRNTRQPTSYFCAASHYDFFGGYDHGKNAGVVHIGDHDVSVGKKMFTWAYNQLSRSWEKALTDDDGMYAELMASSYSNNQPDFAWLEPYEEKTFSQFWYPIANTGVPVCATVDAALSISQKEVLLYAVRNIKNARILINGKEHILSVCAGETARFACAEEIYRICVMEAGGQEILRYCPSEERPEPVPEPISDNPTLDQLSCAQEAYLAGVHVEQYRDPAIKPDSYFTEALRLDESFAPAHLGLAKYLYEHFYFEDALLHAQKAWDISTKFNFHPISGDIPYLIGLCLESVNKTDEAYDWYQKAAWAYDSRSKAMTRIAMIDLRRGHFLKAQEHAGQAIRAHAGNSTAHAVLAMALKKLNDIDGAKKALLLHLKEDPLDRLLIYLLERLGEKYDYTALTDEWQNVLDTAELLELMGEGEEAKALLENTVRPKVTAWPSRKSEYLRLKESGKDDFGLACLLYHKGHYEEAAKLWEGLKKDHKVLRNLAAAYFSHLGRREEALLLMREALRLKPDSQQLIYETVYLMSRLSMGAKQQVEFIEERLGFIDREDIIVEYARALNQDGQYDKALDVLLSTRFTPCEGGEHAIANQYMFAKHALGRIALEKGEVKKALELFREAQVLPDSLGAGLWNEVMLVPHRFFESKCLKLLGDEAKAKEIWFDITALLIDYFSNMHMPELRCWQAMAYTELGQTGRAHMMLKEHISIYTQAKQRRDAGFNKTTPFFISFVEPAKKLRDAACDYQLAFAYFAMGDTKTAKAFAESSLSGEPSGLMAYLI